MDHTSMFFNSLFFTCHWIQFVFLLYSRFTCSAPIWSTRLSPTQFLGEFPGTGLGSSTPCCGPRDGAEVRILVHSFIALITCDKHPVTDWGIITSGHWTCNAC